VETNAAADLPEERSRTDKMVDGMDFGQLCNDFECISSPYVESTARRLARDILELREDNRAFNCYAVSVKYKVLMLMRSFCATLLDPLFGNTKAKILHLVGDLADYL